MTETVTETETETVTAEAAVDRRPLEYIDAADLQNHASDVGLSCLAAQEQTDLMNFASTRSCAEGYAMAVWQDREQMSLSLPLLSITLQQLATASSEDVRAVLGQNWVIFGTDPLKVPKELGGVHTFFPAEGDANEMVALAGGTDPVEGESNGPSTSITEGVWTVGRDIAPGTYTTTGPVSDRCYWKISVTGSNGDNIVANDIVSGGRPTVTLSEGQDFQTSRCGAWKVQ